jgi:hypothetical protein
VFTSLVFVYFFEALIFAHLFFALLLFFPVCQTVLL